LKGVEDVKGIAEIAAQLRYDAESRQVDGARIGLVENGGGVIGLEEAVCAVTILESAGSLISRGK
jgi:hypothetical protein